MKIAFQTFVMFNVGISCLKLDFLYLYWTFSVIWRVLEQIYEQRCPLMAVVDLAADERESSHQKMSATRSGGKVNAEYG